MTIQELRDSLRGVDTDTAISRISDYIAAHNDDDEAYLLRGMKHWSAGHRAKAINDYLEAIRLNPDSRAIQALQAANDILDYYNKDLLNP